MDAWYENKSADLQNFKSLLPQLIEKRIFKDSAFNFIRNDHPDILERPARLYKWYQDRLNGGCWFYCNRIEQSPAPAMKITNESGLRVEGLNFASQDYLSLSSHKDVLSAARDVIDEYGVHCAGSPMLQGATILSKRLEMELADFLKMEHSLLFSTGWAAGYGVITGLVRKNDHVVIDRLIHNCLSQGANAATQKVHPVNHLDKDAILKKLISIRATDQKNGILVVTEGLFSTDADTPDIAKIQEMCREYNAVLLVDVAHDLGSLGPGGTGSLGTQGMLGKVDIVMGSFSKTFASNGGFVATNKASMKHYLKIYCPTHMFSNGISQVQCAVVNKALQIVRSDEGELLRSKLMKAITSLRSSFERFGISCIGSPSPIVPVPLGDEMIAMITAYQVFRRGVFANIVEFPAVARGNARFRMQVMAGHSEEQTRKAAQIIAESLNEARQIAQEFAHVK